MASAKLDYLNVKTPTNVKEALQILSEQRFQDLSTTTRQALATYIETTISELEVTAGALGDTPRAGELRKQADELRTAYNAATNG
jgi:predicted transcriptional regulator